MLGFSYLCASMQDVQTKGNTMTKFLTKQPENTTKQNTIIPKSAYNFVEQYVLADPNNLNFCGYEMWDFCEMTPVAYQQTALQSGWLNTVELPSIWVQKFLNALKNSSPDVRNDPTQRLISVINMNAGHKLYITPHLKDKTGSYLISEYENDNKRKYDWVLYVTPEINRAIVEQIKIRSRQGK